MTDPSTIMLPEYGADLQSMLVTIGVFLVVLITLALIVQRVLRRRTPEGTADKLITLRSTRRLGPNADLHLIEVQGRSWLVGTGTSGVMTIQPVDSSAAEAAPDFGDVLRGVRPASENGAHHA